MELLDSSPLSSPMPSWPRLLEPQVHTVPSLRMAAVLLVPADTCHTSSMAARTGTIFWVWLKRRPVVSTLTLSELSWPLPSCPAPLAPQAKTEPYRSRATAWPSPAATETMSVR
ncbi:hypothetical protein CE91St43_27980 [Oscillospiraceae bacterium]|nr:hypothetical protein CE91St43_27980 [Oscillospiraceae bacterium]